MLSKRVLLIFLVAMAMSLFSGCKDDKDNNNNIVYDKPDDKEDTDKPDDKNGVDKPDKDDKPTIKATNSVTKSGQTHAYAYFDDGYFSEDTGVERSFTKNDSKKIVIDNVTGLVWQNDLDASTEMMDWQSALSYCEELVLFGNRDWTLPSISELSTVINRGKNRPAIDDEFADNTAYIDGFYWTSTTSASDSDLVWAVDFRRGSLIDDVNKSSSNFVRCVTSKPLKKPSFKKDLSKEVVVDTSNGLMWQNVRKIKPRSWERAVKYCANMTFPVDGGYDDWRLPTINELSTIVDRSKRYSTLDSEFSSLNNKDIHWSSTTDSIRSIGNVNNRAWFIRLSDGVESVSKKDNEYIFRCVRDSVEE